ncbi:MAG: V-type ATP synthase subunit I [Candidatus Nanohaloarchaea archaeon]
MTKVSVTAPKTQLENVVESLHSLGLMDFDDYEGELETGSPMEGSDEISQLLVDIRSILSKLDVNETEQATVEDVREKVPEVHSSLKESEAEISSLKSRKEQLKDKKKSFEKILSADVNLRELEDTDTLNYRILDFKEEEFSQIYGSRNYEVFHGKTASVLAYMNKEEDHVNESLEGLVKKEFDIPVEDGTPEQIVNQINSEISDIEASIESEKEKINRLESTWGPKFNHVEQFLTEKIEKAEAPLKFGTTEKSFIVEGWVPSEEEAQLKKSITASTDNKVHIETMEGEDPPVKHDNNKIVTPFESLTDLMARPKYGEVDPSFLILLTFPLFFGMMIGDAGYGITSGLVFLAGIKFFPQASKLFKALLWTSAATMVFGIIYGEFFGFHVLDTPFYRGDLWTEIFYLSIAIGVAHVNLGLLIGAYNEYVHHGILEALFAKGSWILLQIAGLAGYLTASSYGTTPGLAIGLGIGIPTLMMLYKGEGIEGIVEIPSLVSNILSYLRLFGVCMAAYTLAGTVNQMANPMLASGSLMGIAGGVLIMIIGHTVLTFVKIMEGFLQGIRLHYVEQFGWFYEGGGRKYSPFGGE